MSAGARRGGAILVLLLVPGLAFSQQQPSAAGTWSGAIAAGDVPAEPS